MSNKAYDFLADSKIFSCADTNYRDLTLKEIDQELNNYKKHIDENYEALLLECKREKPEINLISNFRPLITLPTKDEILRGSLFLNKMIIDDPIYEFRCENLDLINMDRITRNFPILTKDGIKQTLSNKAKYMKSLTPGVISDVGYIKFFPLSKNLSKQNLNKINMPDLSIPKEIESLFQWCAHRIELLEIDESRRVKTLDKICDHIGLRFTDDYENPIWMNKYSRLSIVKDENGEERFALINVTPEQDEFDNWVNQETIKTIKEKINHLIYKYDISCQLDAPLVIVSNFEKELLKNQFNKEITPLIELGYNMNFPGFEKTSLEKVMDVRRYCYDSFGKFRSVMYEDAIQIMNCKSEDDFKKMAMQISQRYQYEVEVLEKEVKKIPKIDLNTIISVGISGLSYFTMSSPSSYVITGLAIIQILYNQIKNIKEQNKENPYFFLYKI